METVGTAQQRGKRSHSGASLCVVDIAGRLGKIVISQS